ncbi:MAG: WYL domain-containing protein [Pleurocapsa minor HA4230-MV1]|jgi:ABC-type uncharacterized transport system substrate-binding protein|nr:WYL domain-containing protein [Pleurocapsa minor HA4230-MV1]
MNQSSKINRYTNIQALERLLLLIAILIKYPGVGCPNELEKSDDKHHNALKLVQIKLQELALSLGIDLPEQYPATATLRKDLELLRDYQILDHRMYRWGYYLGTGVMSKQELKAAFNALESQAIYQGDPQLRNIYYSLKKRLRGFEFEEQQDFFYPVRQHLNRAINYTDPQEMMNQGEYRHTLYHQIELLEEAIITGQAIELSRNVDPYGENKLGLITLYPLQLIYFDIAWYLIYENAQDGTLSTGRINRFKDYLKVVTSTKARKIAEQQKSLNNAHQLIRNGWGLKLGTFEEQQLELAGKLALISAKVRFFPPVSAFIAEGERRHPRQIIEKHPDYLDYSLKLPLRSLAEFGFWINRYSDNVIVLSPPELKLKHRQAAMSLMQKYQEREATEMS